MKITKIRKRKNIRKSKKSINNQHGGTKTYQEYKSYIKECKEAANAEYICQRRWEEGKYRGHEYGSLKWDYDQCMYDFKHRCKERYIKVWGQPPSFFSQIWS